MKHPLFLLAIAMMYACLPQTRAQLSSDWTANTPKTSVNAVLVHFETGGCRGYCPIYKLTFRHDGTMDYFGSRHVEEVGEKTIKLSADEFSQLQNAVRRANLAEQPSRLPTNIADAPAHTFTVFDGNKKHSVVGMGPLPEHIQALDKLMQNIAEAHGIMVKNGVDPNDPAAMKGQVLVELKPDVNAGNFCMQFMEFKTRPVRRVSEENIWILGFNPSELTEAQFIEILRSMQGVVSAQPNKPSKARN